MTASRARVILPDLFRHPRCREPRAALPRGTGRDEERPRVEAPATSHEGTRSAFATFLIYWMPVLLYITMIVVVSAQANLTPPLKFRNADKLFHVAEYFVLGLLLARAAHASVRAR